MRPRRESAFPAAHALAALGAANLFEMLRVAAGVTDGTDWSVIHAEPNVIRFENQRGLEAERIKYNDRSIGLAAQTAKPVLGEHAGLNDYFAPIVAGGVVRAVLVTGPFLMSRPTAVDVLERWRRLTGRQGHTGDPEFVHYASLLLATLVLDGGHLAVFRRSVGSMARLLAGDGPVGPLVADLRASRTRLEECRFVERVWDATRAMVDDREGLGWASPYALEELGKLGLSRAPDRALVGVLVAERPDLDSVDDLVRRDAVQRACVALARRVGDVVSGRVGEDAVTFLACGHRRLVGTGERAVRLARRFGFGLHLGTSVLPASAPLFEHHRSALGAAESALSSGPGSGAGEVPVSLRDLRRELGLFADERPGALLARFDRYVAAIAGRFGHRLEAARAHLESGFDRVVEMMQESRAIEPRSLEEMCAALEQSVRDARTFTEVASGYRMAISDLSGALRQPVRARHDRSLRRALSHIHRHYTEPLGLAAVARVGGFAPKYFSLLFKKRERTTFELYVRNLRVERARRLLAQTDLSVGRVAVLAGFRTSQYLARVFKRSTGMTALESRQRARLAPPPGRRTALK